MKTYPVVYIDADGEHKLGEICTDKKYQSRVFSWYSDSGRHRQKQTVIIKHEYEFIFLNRKVKTSVYIDERVIRWVEHLGDNPFYFAILASYGEGEEFNA